MTEQVEYVENVVVGITSRGSRDCSSPKTVVAPMINVTTPMAVATKLFPDRLALFTIPSIAAAPSSPSNPCSCACVVPTGRPTMASGR